MSAETMKVIRRHEFGGPEHCITKDEPKLELKAGEVRRSKQIEQEATPRADEH